MPHKVSSVPVGTYEDAALLRSKGVEFDRVEMGSNGKVILHFMDLDGAASRILREHQSKGVSVNSLKFQEALRWTKDRIFSARRSAGLY